MRKSLELADDEGSSGSRGKKLSAVKGLAEMGRGENSNRETSLTHQHSSFIALNVPKVAGDGTHTATRIPDQFLIRCHLDGSTHTRKA